MYLMNVAIVSVLVCMLYQCFVYGYHVSALLHCISVLYKCYVFLLHYHCIANCFYFFGCFFVVVLLFFEGLDILVGGGGPFLYQLLTRVLTNVRIIMIFMWLWFVARQPNSSMLLSITSAIP